MTLLVGKFTDCYLQCNKTSLSTVHCRWGIVKYCGGTAWNSIACYNNTANQSNSTFKLLNTSYLLVDYQQIIFPDHFVQNILYLQMNFFLNLFKKTVHSRVSLFVLALPIHKRKHMINLTQILEWHRFWEGEKRDPVTSWMYTVCWKKFKH